MLFGNQLKLNKNNVYFANRDAIRRRTNRKCSNAYRNWPRDREMSESNNFGIFRIAVFQRSQGDLSPPFVGVLQPACARQPGLFRHGATDLQL